MRLYGQVASVNDGGSKSPAVGHQYQAAAREGHIPQRKFEVQALQEDFNILREVLQEVHIGLHRYASKATMDSLFTRSYSSIKAPMTETDFFKIVNRVVTSIRDEHTFALPSREYWDNQIGQTVYYHSGSKSGSPLFPFFIKIIDNRLFIDNNLSNDLSLNRGTEILQINDLSSRQILETLLPTIHTNGFIETFRRRNLEQFSLHQTYNRFMVHYAIFIGRPDTFRLKVRKYGDTAAVSVDVPALTSKEIFNNYWRRYSTVNDPKKTRENPFEFALLDHQTAYLRLSDFHNYVWLKYNYSPSTEFRAIFDLIRERSIQNLIIDLRGNEGGNLRIGVELLKYLTKQDFRPYNYHEVKNYRFPDVRQYFSDSTALKDYPDELFILQKDGTYRSDAEYETEEWSRPMQRDPKAYQHNLYVLINGATGSAASILATLIRVNRKDAIFIGEESGGDMEGPVSGTGTDITLPNTKIRVDIPFVKRVVNLNGYEPLKGRGILPDYTVAPSLDDFAGNKDTELEFTISLIKSNPD
ncbi:S41 family peptidase [Anseongella ginsenosidimutans]|nr:S41 family peptidase [Anseongella ginsenosidimutans]